jgi:hypothetical protein
VMTKVVVEGVHYVILTSRHLGDSTVVG